MGKCMTPTQMLYMAINYILEDCNKSCEKCAFALNPDVCLFGEIDWTKVPPIRPGSD